MTHEHEFDKQINDSFGGIGKQRTALSGTWANYITEAIAFLKVDWQIAACWQDNNRIIVTLRDSEWTEWMIAASIASVSRFRAIQHIASEMWRKEHPAKRYGVNGGSYVPDNVVCHDLYYELWQFGREHEYEALGGLYTGSE